MRTRTRLILLAVGVYLAGLVVLFPAALAVRWFLPDVPGLVVGPAQGTIWNGRINSVEYRGWNAGALTWSVRPLTLFLLRASADVNVLREGRETLSARASVSTNGETELAGLRGTLTIADLEQAGLVPRNFASGELMLNMERLVFSNNRPVAADGRLGLSELGSPLLPDTELGSYAAEVETGDEGIVARFSELEAPVSISGDARLAPEGRYTVSGSLAAKPEAPEMLKRGLALMGSPDSRGRYRFNFEGTL